MKILIVTLDNIGDTLISLAIHEALRRYPGYHTAFWTKEYSGGVIPLAGADIEHYHCDPFWDRSPGTGKGGFLAYARTILKIRRAGFDAALILHSNWRKNLSCLLAGIGKRYAQKGAFSTHYAAPSTGNHELDLCRALVSGLTGKDPGALSYPLTPAAYGETEASARLFSNGAWAVLHPFSGNPRRNLPMVAWPPIVDSLLARNMRVLVNAAPAEKALFEARFAGAAKPGDLVFSCDLGLDIRNLAYAVSRARIFIGNNSGPLHLASALGTPCVGIFQKSWVEKIAPRGKSIPELAVFENDPSEIGAAEIIAKAEMLLGPAKPRPGDNNNC
ncbi:MAG TPA: hypothetical protein DCS63_01485 [Elusimicrobia bacterium]|nr:hypothetical protein [Elusimicrobiota bacterium]